MMPALRSYYRHRFPAEIICHSVWLYHAFSLSLHDVELILAERGVVAIHETGGADRWVTPRNLSQCSPQYTDMLWAPPQELGVSP